MKSQFIFILLIATAALIVSHSSVKSQQPIIVQAANGARATSSPAAPISTTQSSSTASPEAFVIAIRTLEQIKSGNAEVLKRQEATLQRLDEIQQAAEELKVFSKRG
jgi:hypothetical protein